MTSEKQILANRRNAEKSTGAISQEGKEAVRFNAVKHGLCAQSLLPGDDTAQVTLLSESLFSEIKPVGPIEEMLTDRVVMLSWRLRRLGQIEMGIFIQQFSEQVLDHEFAKADRRPATTTSGRVRSTNLARLQAQQRQIILDSVNEPCAKARIEKARAGLDEDVALLGAAYRRDSQQSDAISKLLRYETTLEKSLLRTLHELQRLQAMRAGKAVLPPVAIDINLSSE